ncbi:M81 family metallopeptidase [Ferrovibrio xuzhouensis]|uniref:Microcystinase C n=1 Tax=Ferrovibrio xuzhouensis TaxID=1576914 RepID=A0ABV7VDT1_9PROT
MRLYAAALFTETNTFSPIPTARAGFEEGCHAAPGRYPDYSSPYGAPLWEARRRAKADGHMLVEGPVAYAQPAGTTTRAAYESLRDELLDHLKQNLPVDVVLLGLHGAMVADGYDDCEGDLLARIRTLVGPDTVIGAELDPHCQLSQAMQDNADILICFKEYPHIDFAERAVELVDLCLRAAAGEIRPVMASFDCRMIDIYHTTRAPMRGYVDRLSALEGQDGILSVSVAHGFPWGDVPDLSTKLLVVADRDAGKAAALAETLGRELYGLRGTTAPKYLTIDTALDQALAHNSGTVVIAESADNAGGGAPSDATFLLRRVLERGIAGVAHGPFWDPVAVSLCFAAGPGARLPLRLGGKTGPMSGAPLDLEVEVRSLVRNAMQSFGAAQMPLGDAACLRVLSFDGQPAGDDVEVVVNTLRNQAKGLELFTAHGIDLAQKRIVVVKSSQHFHAAYAPVAQDVLYVGGPGAIAADIAQLDYRRITRPKWPFDADPLGA